MEEVESIQSDGETAVQAVDPEEYTQNRRLKQVHDAKEWVREIRLTAHEKMYSRSAKNFSEDDYQRVFAEAVVDYGIELEPIMVQSESDILSRKVGQRADVSDVLRTGGIINGEYIEVAQSRRLQREFNKFLAKVGLGVDIEEKKGPAEI